jgi:hypothetical protein
MAVPPVRAGNFQGRNKPFEITAPLMLEHRRIWVIGTVPSRRQSAGQLRDESMVLLDRFSLVATRHFRNIVVTLWLRR